MESLPQPVLVLSSPRSGSTWLAKILDSHPNTLYRHESDRLISEPKLPFDPLATEIDGLVDDARLFLEKALNLSNLFTTGTLPIFKKDYRTSLDEISFRGLIYALKGFSSVAPFYAQQISRFSLPEGVNKKYRSLVVPVLKSVDSLRRTNLFSQAMPESRIIHLVRHPCGYVASTLRGRAKGYLNKRDFIKDIAHSPESVARNITEEYLHNLSEEERLAVRWMVSNEKVIKEMKESGNYLLVTYEDLCFDTFNVARRIFNFIGLEWSQATDAFIEKCLSQGGGEKHYFQILRDPRKAVEKWKAELTEEQQARVIGQVGNSLAGELFLDP